MNDIRTNQQPKFHFSFSKPSEQSLIQIATRSLQIFSGIGNSFFSSYNPSWTIYKKPDLLFSASIDVCATQLSGLVRTDCSWTAFGKVFSNATCSYTSASSRSSSGEISLIIFLVLRWDNLQFILVKIPVVNLKSGIGSAILIKFKFKWHRHFNRQKSANQSLYQSHLLAGKRKRFRKSRW